MNADDYQRSIQTELNPVLLIGVPSIDKQHYALVKQLDELVGNPEAIPGTESFSIALGQLGELLNEHFVHEERFFMSLGMPPDIVESHLDAHADILDQYAQLKLDLRPGKELSRLDVIKSIKGWVIEHVVLHDLGIKQYVSKNSW